MRKIVRFQQLEVSYYKKCTTMVPCAATRRVSTRCIAGIPPSRPQTATQVQHYLTN